MGKYRFFLSILVALSHIGFYVAGINQGIVAVMSFLLISGFTMQIHFEKYYRPAEIERVTIGKFYLDRVLRIYPQYIFWCVITVVYVFFFPVPDSLNECLRGFSINNFLRNLAIFPVGFNMFNGLSYLIIPAAWTLALELTFYIIFPFIYKYNLHKVCIMISGGVFLLAYCGAINTEWYGYRLLPGTLFVFLTGCLLGSNKYKNSNIPMFVWFFSILLMVGYMNKLEYHLGYNREVLIGIILGIPMMMFLKDKVMTKWDIILGNLSYGIYLNHFQIKYVMRMQPTTILERIIFFAISILLAGIGYLIVEKPITKFRRGLRDKSAQIARSLNE